MFLGLVRRSAKVSENLWMLFCLESCDHKTKKQIEYWRDSISLLYILERHNIYPTAVFNCTELYALWMRYNITLI